VIDIIVLFVNTFFVVSLARLFGIFKKTVKCKLDFLYSVLNVLTD
jgi:hypothetical protein